MLNYDVVVFLFVGVKNTYSLVDARGGGGDEKGLKNYRE